MATPPNLNPKQVCHRASFMDDINSIAANQNCAICGYEGLSDGQDGFFYCPQCGSQADDIVDAGIADEDFVGDRGHGRDAHGALYSVRNTRHIPIKAEPISQVPFSPTLYDTLSQAVDPPVEPKDHVGPTEPSDFGLDLGDGLSPKDYYVNVRMSYVYGLQLMINFQCEALVEKFNVNPLICGISGPIWLRYLRFTRVFDDGWAEEVQLQSQAESQVYNKMYTLKSGGKHEPRNSCNQRMVMLWYRALRKKIPLSCTLAIVYLSCHVAREPVLPTDIQKWTLEGKIPYLAAFVEIEKTIKSTRQCPIDASSMFRPTHVVPLQKLESLAADVADSVGLELPPVNFYAIASRYLKQLSLPVEKILPFACSIHEWSMPPGLWPSTNERRLPTRVSVMAILIVAIRILYNLNGLGKWEASLLNDVDSEANADAAVNDPSSVHKLEHEASQMLRDLEKKCWDSREELDYSKDLETYLRYCKDVVFGGLKPEEDFVEEKLIKKLWDFYQKNSKDSETQEEAHVGTKRMREPEHEEGNSVPSEESRDKAIKLMKLHMEENRFVYIPPRKNIKQLDYLYYKRNNDDGSLAYVAHADYYILLYSCAREAQVDPRVLHQGVMSFERRLAWIEKRVDGCLSEVGNLQPQENQTQDAE